MRRKYTKPQIFSDILAMIDNEKVTPEGKLFELFQAFRSEYNTPYSQKVYPSVQDRLEQWLRGLPSIINHPFSNYDILQWAIKIGTLPENHTEKQADKILENYWRWLAASIVQLGSKFKVKILH